jgi:Ni/Co efflux regulator RcnB
MKMMMAGALALSIAAGSVATAQPYGKGPGHDQGNHGDQGDRGARGGDRGDRGDASSHQNWGRDYGGQHRYKRGQRIGYNDWSRAPAVDYRQHHLRQPPRGYEWRESNGQYIMAAVATGVIASIILNAGR